MHELAPGTDRYGAEVTVTAEGLWHFQVEAWGDPIAHWRHDAAIKVPRGLESELMLAEGALLFERAARAVRGTARPGQGARAGERWANAAQAAQSARAARAALRQVAAQLRDRALPPWDRLAAACGPGGAGHPGPVPAARPGHPVAAVPADRAPAARAVRRVV